MYHSNYGVNWSAKTKHQDSSNNKDTNASTNVNNKQVSPEAQRDTNLTNYNAAKLKALQQVDLYYIV